MEFNPYQLRAISTPGHCTILACPGSGKTRVLSERASRLIQNSDKGRLCAVTFTKDSAAELKDRILKTCPDPGLRLAVGTFHSVALSQLKRFVKSPPKLLHEGARRALLRRCFNQHNTGFSFEDVVAAVDSAKSKLSAHQFSDPVIEEIYHEYCAVLKSEHAMDFADILRIPVQMMLNGTLDPLPIRWLLVDEAQDMDEIQMEWVLIHGRAGVEITLVADDDQSLYSFRNALGYKGLCQINQSLSSMEMTLPINYRSPPNVLQHAAKLIQCNPDRADKKIAANKTEPGELRLVRGANREDEFSHMLQKIMLYPVNGAVLARTNAILDDVEKAIVLHTTGIRYIRDPGQSIWDKTIGSELLGLIRAVTNNSWTGIANALALHGVSSTLVNQHSRDNARANYDCAESLNALKRKLEKDPTATPGAKHTVNTLYQYYCQWWELSYRHEPDLVIDGITDFLLRACKTPKQENLLRDLSESLINARGSLAQKIALLGINRPDEQDDENQPLKIMTLHSSKGLEFENVWIVGAEEGNLPHTDAAEEDERRLFYVGMTRTKNRLFISSSIEDGIESRFLGEAGLV